MAYYLEFYVIWNIVALPEVLEQQPCDPVLPEVYIVTCWAIPIQEFSRLRVDFFSLFFLFLLVVLEGPASSWRGERSGVVGLSLSTSPLCSSSMMGVLGRWWVPTEKTLALIFLSKVIQYGVCELEDELFPQSSLSMFWGGGCTTCSVSRSVMMTFRSLNLYLNPNQPWI